MTVDRSTQPEDLDVFWAETMAELMSRPPKPDVEPLPIRSTDFAECMSVRLTSLNDYQIHAYFSRPNNGAPFPVVYHTPGYASVVPIPPYHQRKRHAVLTLCARGQRLADRPYAASFPGFLTDGIDNRTSYPMRGFIADACRGIDYIKSRNEVDPKRIIAVGGDSALFVAALRPEVHAVVVSDPFMIGLGAVAPGTSAYPHEEINDYRRAFPDRVQSMLTTLGYFDPIFLADRIRAEVLISCGPLGSLFGPAQARTLADAISGPVEIFERSGRGHNDHVFVENWIAKHGGASAVA